MLNWPAKDPDGTFDYRWNPPLDAGDKLASASVALVSGDVTIQSQTMDDTGLTVVLTGGSVGANLFRGVWASTGGRSDDEYIGLQVQDNAPSPIMPAANPGAFQFAYEDWAALYPALTANVTARIATLYFMQAQLYLGNTAASLVSDLGTRGMLLYLLVAHIAVLNGALEADGKPNGLVGRITNATEGSVSVSVDAGAEPGSAGWYAQTTYGYQFWAATRQFRSARYIGPPPRQFDPFRARRGW